MTSRTFLHANSTSHTWSFSAIAELIDNAYDPDVAASKLCIDYEMIGGESCLTFTDNGNGLNAEKLHRMLSFGYCEKVEIQGHKPVGHYGNGFKSGSMRLGKDALVLTKHTDTRSVGFLSQNFLNKIQADTVLVPILTFDKQSNKFVQREDTQSSLKAITEYSLFKSVDVILNEFEKITSDRGTRIIIYDLKRGNDGKLELDFESDPVDIINSEHQALDFSTSYRPVREYIPLYRQSLREYCSILFLKPRMKIVIREKKVKTKLVSKSLNRTEKDVYKPVFMDRPTKIIFGFGHSPKDYGLMLYHRNRLIKAYEKVGYQKSGEGKGKGVVGVVSVDFLEPIHNKQDFNKTDRYNACMQSLGNKLNDYWLQKTDSPVTIDSQASVLPDWTWAQCDLCLKWRRLPDGYSDKDLPDKWFCRLNPDPTHRRCDMDEEPEDEDELLSRATYEKTVKGKLQKEKAKKRVILETKEKELNRKEMELQRERNRLQQAQVGGSTTVASAELEKARRALEQARSRETQQQALILQLRKQAQTNTYSAFTVSPQTSGANSQPAKRKSTETPDSATDVKKKKTPVSMEFDGFMITRNESGSESESETTSDKPADDEVILIESDDEVAEWSKKKKGKLPKVTLGGKRKEPPANESEGSDNDVKPTTAELEAATATAVNSGIEIKQEKPDSQEADIKPKVEDIDNGMNISNVESVSDTKKTDDKASPSSTAAAAAKTPKSSASTTKPGSSPTTSKAKEPTPSTSSGIKRKGYLSKYVQTSGDTGASGATNSTATKKELEKVKNQLSSLRKNVSQLLKVLVPELEVKDLSLIDDIVVEMIKVNSQQTGEGDEGDEGNTGASNGTSSEAGTSSSSSGASTSEGSTRTASTDSGHTDMQVTEVKEEPPES